MPPTDTFAQLTMDWLKTDPHAPLRLFCFHHAGGSAVAYRPWARHLRRIELIAIELPGRSRLVNMPPFTSLTPLLAALTPTMLPVLREKPFAFFGHSMGALVAFELARQVRRIASLTPELLFVSGHRAPSFAPETTFHTFDDDALSKRLMDLNGTPREALQHPELMQIMLPLIRADFAVCETYQYLPEPPLDCPIYAFGGTSDPDVWPEHLEPWQEQTSAACSVSMFEGDHFYLSANPTPVLQAIDRALQQVIEQLEAAS